MVAAPTLSDLVFGGWKHSFAPRDQGGERIAKGDRPRAEQGVVCSLRSPGVCDTGGEESGARVCPEPYVLLPGED